MPPHHQVNGKPSHSVLSPIAPLCQENINPATISRTKEDKGIHYYMRLCRASYPRSRTLHQGSCGPLVGVEITHDAENGTFSEIYKGMASSL